MIFRFSHQTNQSQCQAKHNPYNTNTHNNNNKMGSKRFNKTLPNKTLQQQRAPLQRGCLHKAMQIFMHSHYLHRRQTTQHLITLINIK